MAPVSRQTGGYLSTDPNAGTPIAAPVPKPGNGNFFNQPSVPAGQPYNPNQATDQYTKETAPLAYFYPGSKYGDRSEYYRLHPQEGGVFGQQGGGQQGGGGLFGQQPDWTNLGAVNDWATQHGLSNITQEQLDAIPPFDPTKPQSWANAGQGGGDMGYPGGSPTFDESGRGAGGPIPQQGGQPIELQRPGVGANGELQPGYHWEWTGGVTGGKTAVKDGEHAWHVPGQGGDAQGRPISYGPDGNPLPYDGSPMAGGGQWGQPQGTTAPGGPAPGGGASSTPGGTGTGSIDAILKGIDPNNWTAGLAAREADLKALGYTLQRNSNGDVRGRLYDPSGNAYDPFQQYGWKTTSGAGAGSIGGMMGGGNGFYGSMWNTVPTEAEALAMPGMQFAINQGQKGIERSAAAKGTLLTGGTMKDLAGYTTGAALSQGYIPLATLRNNTNQSNVNNLYNLTQLGQSSSTYGSTGRPA